MDPVVADGSKLWWMFFRIQSKHVISKIVGKFRNCLRLGRPTIIDHVSLSSLDATAGGANGEVGLLDLL